MPLSQVLKMILSRVIRIENPRNLMNSLFLKIWTLISRCFCLHVDSSHIRNPGATPELLLQQKDSKVFVMVIYWYTIPGVTTLYISGETKEVLEQEMVGIHMLMFFLRHNYRLIHSNGPYLRRSRQSGHT